MKNQGTSPLKSRPCGFGQSLGQPIVRSFSHFFWSTKKKLSSLREFLVSLWFFLVSLVWSLVTLWYQRVTNFQTRLKKKIRALPKKIRDWPKIPWDWTNFFWLTKKNEKKTGQLVDQESDQNHMDGTIVAYLSSIGVCSSVSLFSLIL